jgi:hypothetical protein
MVIAIIAAMTMGLLVRAKRRAAQTVGFDFRTNALSYLPNEYVTYRITGAPPNTAIHWSTWLRDSPRDVNVFRGDYTDGNGAWTSRVSIPTEPGHWIYDAIISGVSRRAEFDVVEGGDPWWYCHLSSIRKCKEIALEKGSQYVRVANPFSVSYTQEFDLSAIKQHYLVVQKLEWHGTCSEYDTSDDVIRSYDKFKVQILHQPTAPLPVSPPPITPPPCVGTIAADEIVLAHKYGSVTLDGVQINQQPFGLNALADYQPVLILRRESNPQIVTLATGPTSIYPTNAGNILRVNDYGDYVMDHKGGYHPFISLNPTPFDPRTSPNFSISVTNLASILNQP